MMQIMKTKLLLVDDHDVTLHGLSIYSEKVKNSEVVGKAKSGVEALELLSNTSVDIVITDVDMPEMDGLDLLKVINKEYPHIKVIACTMHINSWVLQKLIKNNVSGIISKSSVKQDIDKAVAGALSGEPFYSKDVYDAIMGGMRNNKRFISKYDQVLVTKRESQILTLIADEMTTSEIADNLGLSINTIETHRKNLLLKFGVRNVVGLVRRAMEQGLVE